MGSEENTSPADYLYQGLPELLPEYDSLLIQLVVLHLTVWQIIHDQDQGFPTPPMEIWVETLRRIPNRPPNPLEELSCQAQETERDEDIDEVSSDSDQLEQQKDKEGQQQQQEEQQEETGARDDPVDVDREARFSTI